MNRTLDKLRELAQESALSAQDSQSKARRTHESCAQLAAPLIRAFRDVESEFVRISVLKQIWPTDYHRRDDRVSVLLVGMLGPEEAPYGLKLIVPYGYLRFEVALKSDGLPVFSCVRDTQGQRPMSMDFPDADRWLEFFYKSIADLVEL
ncbi:hypothetical protein [Thiorhodococcus fuscus]|uniref:Uncharacterized protein n=1 Tax=Thiorhodococcus fuscus TaxID=527200 RepID=A0ABW4YAN7_9GAMM